MSEKTELDLLMEKSADEIVTRLVVMELMIIGLATEKREYRKPDEPLGIKPPYMEEDFSCLEIWERLLVRHFIMEGICGKYNLEFPTDSKRSNKKQFREWLEGVVKKRWPADRASDILECHNYLCDFMNRHVAKYNEEQRRKKEGV